MSRRLLFPLGLVFLAAVVAYLRFVRQRWVLDWGATYDERGASLPGDGIVPHPTLQTTRVITVEATPAEVWPWIVQMGPRPRAGVYTYDWLERLLGIDVKNADRILPEFQQLEPGQFFSLGTGPQGLRVREVRPGRALVLQWEPTLSTWAFVLDPAGDRTRLISRNRIPGGGFRFWLSMIAAMEPGSLIMERKMLQGIKIRAEARQRR